MKNAIIRLIIALRRPVTNAKTDFGIKMISAAVQSLFIASLIMWAFGIMPTLISAATLSVFSLFAIAAWTLGSVIVICRVYGLGLNLKQYVKWCIDPLHNETGINILPSKK